MRVIGEIPHEACKITLFQWNGKYLIKLEEGLVEQTFKISEWDIAEEDDLKLLLDEPFMQKAIARFEEMHQAMREALERVELKATE